MPFGNIEGNLPAIDEFYTLIQKAQEEAKRIGLTEADVDSMIKEVRQKYLSAKQPKYADIKKI